MWIILLDRSESMGRPFKGTHAFAGRTRTSEATTKLEAAKQAIVEHLRGLGTSTRVVLIAFNSAPEVVYDGASNAHKKIGEALDPIKAGGGTNIAAALNAAISAVEAAIAERLFRALVVTDGDDDLAPAATAAAALADCGAIIDVTLIDPTEKGEAVARAIAREGTVSAVASAGELHEGVGKAKVAQQQQEADVEAVIARHDEERAQLAKEKPIEERLAFTAAYPAYIANERWYTLTVYLHLAALQHDVEAAVREEASGLSSPPNLSLGRAGRGVARGTLLTLTPRVHGLRFNPPSETIAWYEDIQGVRFRLWAPAEMQEQSAFGALEVTLGSLPIAHLGVTINVRADVKGSVAPALPQHTGLYQDVFASYSSVDTAIVQACRAVYWGLGIQLAVDKQTLRAGQEWDPALRAIIEKCDLFQLFWSEAASKSLPVRHEYEFALHRLPAKGQGFIRPVVWESPSPRIPSDLQRFHFAPLDLAALARLSNLPVISPTQRAPVHPSSSHRVPVTAVPLVSGASPDLVRSVRDDLSDVVQSLEATTGLRYYPVPTLLVDEHVVKTVRTHEAIDLGPIDRRWADQARALQEYLLAINLQFHVRGLVPGKRGDMDREEYTARFGAGRLLTREQFNWILGACESFPQMADVLMERARAAMHKVGALKGQPQFEPELAEFIPLVLEVGAQAVEGDDPERRVEVHPYLADRIKVPSDVINVFIGAGGSASREHGFPLTGSARSFVALLRDVAERLKAPLEVVQGYDAFRSDPPPPEAAQALQLCAFARTVLGELLPWNHPLRLGTDITEMDSWLEDLISPRWRDIGAQLFDSALTSGPTDSLRDALQAFLITVAELLEESLRAGGDFELETSFEIPEEAWSLVVAELGGYGLTIRDRKERDTDVNVLLTGRYSDAVRLYRAASERLLSLMSKPARPRSALQRVFVEMSPTFGIYAPARSEATDLALYRWAGEQGIAQALTLPGADRVLLCLGAAERFAATLREAAGNPTQAEQMGATFQRCVLIHEHFHAAVACALDAQGVPAVGPTLAEAWSKSRCLNESLAVWMELHYVRGDAAMERLVWQYIQSGAYPDWPYAGAGRLEAQYAASGVDAIRSWILKLRATPELAQKDFDSLSAPDHTP